MSAGFELKTTIAVGQPRRAVIDRAWRDIGPGVEVLSGDDGGPLRRTVNRIIDPLVLRPQAGPRAPRPLPGGPPPRGRARGWPQRHGRRAAGRGTPGRRRGALQPRRQGAWCGGRIPMAYPRDRPESR